MKTGFPLALASLLMLSIIACSGGETPTPTPTPTPDSPPQQTPETVAPTPQSDVGAGGVILEISSGSEARYVVREELARLSLPNDAVGVTQDVEGELVLGPDGAVRTESSLIRVILAPCKVTKDGVTTTFAAARLAPASTPTRTLCPPQSAA